MKRLLDVYAAVLRLVLSLPLLALGLWDRWALDAELTVIRTAYRLDRGAR